MYTLGFSDKQKQSNTKDTSARYLILPSESKEVAAAGRGSFGFRNRYLAKRSVMRTIRRLRHEHA